MPLSEHARSLLLRSRAGVLSTHSQRCPGFPFGSAMPYAMSQQGSPIFFISRLAEHTQNIFVDGRISLFVAESETTAEALNSPRVTLVGVAKPVRGTQAGETYFVAHPKARLWQELADFTFFEMTVERAYFVGGFGVMGWISAEEYRSACQTI